MSLAVRVIPCLDVDDGRVVKGVNFENLRDAGDPVALARRYGEQVAAGATVTVQYAGVRWSDGSTYDSTWTQGGPKSFDLSAGILPGLAEGLVEQTVGSQVMLVIPPASGGAVGAEDDTLVLVVDILAASNPKNPKG